MFGIRNSQRLLKFSSSAASPNLIRLPKKGFGFDPRNAPGMEDIGGEFMEELDIDINLRKKPKFIYEHISGIKRNKNSPSTQFKEEYLDLPWNFDGYPAYEVQTRYLSDRIFDQNTIHKNVILYHLERVYMGVWRAILNRRYDVLEEYLEEKLYTKLKTKLEKLDDSPFDIRFEADRTGGEDGLGVIQNLRMYDAHLIRGVSPTREENLDRGEYHFYDDLNDFGLVIYSPHNVSDPKNFVHKEVYDKIFEQSRAIIFRAFVQIETPYKLHIVDRKTEEKLERYPTEYNWSHAVLFETQMKPPPAFKSFTKVETYMEWIAKHTFGAWKIADMDEYMEWNPLVR
mmetsp:Transcript_29377/g.33545  ORF Transcript_29377/g.33545 Transcript_29377/m.33545 type:complete len:342 (-) Transcript_29377:133-1158(-)